MKNKQTFLLVITLVLLVGALLYFHTRLNRIEIAIGSQSNLMNLPNAIHQTYNTEINIEKVEGNGNVFGDYNNVENKIA